MKQQNQSLAGMPGDQVNEIVGIYCFEFARAGKGTVIWDEFRRFIRKRAEARNMLGLSSIAHFSYVMVTRNMVDEPEVWKYLQDQVFSLLNQRNLSQENLDIENICMIIGSF
jgi:hypothetical protein